MEGVGVAGGLHHFDCKWALYSAGRLGEDKAKMMSSAATVRAQVEAALAGRIPGALTPVAKTIREVMPVGIAAVDEVLEGGLPVGAVTEMIGAECSGRTALALSFVAGVTRAERVCAWVDVSDALSPESAAAAGVDLKRMLWVRCGVVAAARKAGAGVGGNFKVGREVFCGAGGDEGATWRRVWAASADGGKGDVGGGGGFAASVSAAMC